MAASTDQTGKSQDEYVESVVCNQSAIGENEMKVFDIGTDGKVLLAKQDGKIYATGTLCSHYKAPLVTGALGKGKVRCPWHGACFNLATGDIEDFPGLDSIPSYEVKIMGDGGVKVKAKKSDLQENKRVKGMCKLKNKSKSFVIIGGGAAAAKCVETLRQDGFDGRITMVCKEPYVPYDRIKVSKMLDSEPSKIQLRPEDFYKDNSIEVLKGVEATKLDPAQKLVHLANGETLKFDKLFIATGAQPRKLKIDGVDLKNVFTLRHIEDTMSLNKALGSDKDKHVVISGSSFIAMESAAAAVGKAKSVTVVMRTALPLQQFGKAIGERIAEIFKEKGVVLQPNITLSKLEGSGGKVTHALLADGRKLPADIVILAVGSTYNTDFLRGSNVSVNEHGLVPTDEYLETSLKGIYAGGDIAFAPVFVNDGRRLAIGHWQVAHYHGHIAAKNMLGKKTELHTVPFFWTMLFGTGFRYAGHAETIDDVVIDGDLKGLKFTAYFCKGDEVHAVLSTTNATAAYAEYISVGNKLTKKEIQANPTKWLSQVPKGKIK
ncbi:apoptosis-inducing factor 3-like isoform X3 [Macrosteles quadrilineatus]|uniref:apoptosis-inducing factor 3-like isoform X3 n=1 Tax=Macrosteles quadrilineatus TaxID=74068 RepID=UPI0023E20E4F|nr:apoptosis-inducing factor 3-like isoform X3 [Macrosteles quadrilineatus]XP_054272169.1 apoptosis-inducing factor 3-like isoform X3 [Macrosteles quadrilineatus]